MSTIHRYFIIHKPYKMLSQFAKEKNARVLADLNFDFPAGTHAVGRLDNESEGLLILTTNKKVTRLLFESKTPHKRTYLVQVTYAMDAAAVQQLQTGVTIRVRGGGYYTTASCEVKLVQKPNNLFAREKEFLENVPQSWIQMTLTEGKFHQVRKMVKALNYRCMRLIRVAIEDMTLGDLPPGGVQEIEEADFFELLKIADWQ